MLNDDIELGDDFVRVRCEGCVPVVVILSEGGTHGRRREVSLEGVVDRLSDLVGDGIDGGGLLEEGTIFG